MKGFFDTSAGVPLLIEEINSEQIQRLWGSFTRMYAWSWQRVETEAALMRRKADTQSWQAWKVLLAHFHFLTLDSKEETVLLAFNRSPGLGAADAGHFTCLTVSFRQTRTCRF